MWSHTNNLVEVTDDWHCVATPNEERVFFAVIERVIDIKVCKQLKWITSMLSSILKVKCVVFCCTEK